jgi:hypothetical protein
MRTARLVESGRHGEDPSAALLNTGRAKDLQVLPTLHRFLRAQKERGSADDRDAGFDIGF